MKPLTTYIDYRAYLSDYYAFQKKRKRNFNHRYFADKAGISSSSFLSRVIDGKRNLTRPMIEKFASALELSSKEKEFFRHLVLFNQAKTAEEKTEHYAAMRGLSGAVHEKFLQADQYDYFKCWYAPVVRELICIHDFQNDFQTIAASVVPSITARQARETVDLLTRLGLIRRLENGRYEQTERSVSADPRITTLSAREYIDAMIEHARASLRTMTRDVRHVSTMTLGVNKAQYDILIQELDAFKERVKRIVADGSPADRVYELNFAVFPVSAVHGLHHRKVLYRRSWLLNRHSITASSSRTVPDNLFAVKPR